MATINARIDDETKAQVDQVLGLLGISQTQAITAFYQYRQPRQTAATYYPACHHGRGCLFKNK